MGQTSPRNTFPRLYVSLKHNKPYQNLLIGIRIFSFFPTINIVLSRLRLIFEKFSVWKKVLATILLYTKKVISIGLIKVTLY